MKLTVLFVGLVVFRLTQTKSLWGNSDSSEYNQEAPDEQETGDIFESDIMLTPQQKAWLEASFINETTEHSIQKRKATSLPGKRWPGGVVPYVISNSSADDSDVIETAMQHWMDNTCLTFVPRNAERDYLNFIKGVGCFSSVGRQGGKQDISIGRGCQYLGYINHEIGHAIGFWHEHSRPDRDDHIIIHEENIKPGEEHNFRKFSWDDIVTHQVPYDVGSLMHYSSRLYSKNGKPTITAVLPADNRKIGSIRLSSADIELANAMYNNCECEVQKTAKRHNYRYKHIPPTTDVTMIEFEVKAKKGVYIALTYSETVTDMYEIVIGGGRNTVSYIRRCKQCSSKVAVSTPRYLNANEFRGFWISYERATGLIQVGKKGEAHFMQWQDPTPLYPKLLGYSTGFKTTGKFKFCNYWQ